MVQVSSKKRITYLAKEYILFGKFWYFRNNCCIIDYSVFFTNKMLDKADIKEMTQYCYIFRIRNKILEYAHIWDIGLFFENEGYIWYNRLFGQFWKIWYRRDNISKGNDKIIFFFSNPQKNMKIYSYMVYLVFFRIWAI